MVSYDVPYISDVGFKEPDFANYLHRHGRTGRFGTDGIALSFVSDEVDNDMIEQIAKHYNIEIPMISSF